MMRLPCDHCYDSYNEDNLNECARCKADTCWKCAIHAELPDLARGTWWCDRCLKEVGRENLLVGKRHAERRHRRSYSPSERLRATEAVKEAVAKSNPGSIAWPADEAAREALLTSLEVIGVDVGDDSGCFITPPGRMPAGEAELVFTELAYVGLALLLLAPPWEL
jgi:hypothetical protein